jgi:transposase
MEETRRLYKKIELVSADAGYLSRQNCSFIVNKLSALAGIFPKKDSVLNARGCRAWRHMMFDFTYETRKWLRDYHIRSISETGNSVLKSRFPRPLLKRLDCRRGVESFSKICCYNLRRLIYIHYLNEIEIKWLGRSS